MNIALIERADKIKKARYMYNKIENQADLVESLQWIKNTASDTTRTKGAVSFYESGRNEVRAQFSIETYRIIIDLALADAERDLEKLLNEFDESTQ